MNLLGTNGYNFTNLCRTCLNHYEELLNVFDLDSTPALFEMLKEVASVDVENSNSLPTSMCSHCVSRLIDAYNFKQLTLKSENILQEIIVQKDKYFKSEIVETIENVKIKLEWDEDDKTRIELLESSSQSNENEMVESLILDTNDDISESNSNITCKICEGNFSSPFDLIEHMKKHSKLQQRVQRSHVCTVCGKVFSLPRTLMKHKASHSQIQTHINLEPAQNISKVYPCEECSMVYKSAFSLQIHMRKHNNQFPHLCTECGKRFADPRKYKYHLTTHSSETPYKCKLCPKQYKNSTSLKVHIQTHSDKRPYLCSICGKSMRFPADLQYHMRTHTKERPYSCKTCAKTFKMSWHLVVHMRTHTGERPYKCTDCDKAFYTKHLLKKHQIIHSGLKPFECDVCKKSFNSPYTLRVHAFQHTDKRPHTCNFCGKGFIQANYLRAHEKSHHKKGIKDEKILVSEENS